MRTRMEIPQELSYFSIRLEFFSRFSENIYGGRIFSLSEYDIGGRWGYICILKNSKSGKTGNIFALRVPYRGK